MKLLVVNEMYFQFLMMVRRADRMRRQLTIGARALYLEVPLSMWNFLQTGGLDPAMFKI